VEAIRGTPVRRGKPEYFIKWWDYAEEYNAWEPKDNILDENLLALWNTSQQR
jgi:hypothetical protein